MAYVRTRLGRLFYQEHGTSAKNAPAVLLLHSFLCDGRMWRHQVEPIAAHARAIVLDGPGHGKSEDPPRFSLEDHAEALFDVLTELSIDRVILVGLSWGGMISMRFALGPHAKMLAGLALLDTNAHAEPMTMRVKNRVLLSMHRRVGVPMALYHREVAPLFFGPRTLRERHDLVEETGRIGLGFSRDGVARAGLAVVVKRSDISAKISRINTPTLVMCGTDDKATPPDESRFIANTIPHARMVWIEDAGHLSPLEEPERVNRELVPFIRGLLP
jgi:3-oxoadipate enol-lactonase